MTTRHTSKSYMTPPEIAKLLRVSPEKVIGWIRRGELRAINVSNGWQRKRFLIGQDDLDAFLTRREVHPPPPRPRRMRQAADPDFIEYFK